MRIMVSVLTVSCLVQADPKQFDVETSQVFSPAEARLGKVDGLKLAGGALAAGAGLAFIKNYWNKRPSTSSNTYYKPASSSNTYYSPYQYYHHNNQYPTYYQQPAALTYPQYYQQDQQFSQYKPSSVYYVKPYGAQQSQSMQYNNNNNLHQPPRYTYQMQQQQQQQAQVEDIDTEEMEQRIMEDEGLYSIGLVELPQESRVIKKLLAGSAGLAAGYYLTNKYNEYKDNNKYQSQGLGYGGNKYYTSSSKPSYHYPAYTTHSQPGYKPSYHQNYRPHQPAYPVYNQYQQSYRPPTYNRYPTSTSSSSRPTYYRARDLQARSDSTCFPELVFSVGGNHVYKCRGL